jgi:NodT family efflux transporter outer membrane factor (OMF) lipoprotein
MLNKSLLLPLLAAAAVQGCISVGPNYKTPDIGAPAAYQPEGEVVPPEARYAAGLPSGAWWTAFHSSALDSSIEKALANSPTIAEADARLRSVAASYRAVRGGNLPTIDLNSSRGRERINFAAFGFPEAPPLGIDRYVIGGTVKYDLDIFGGRRRNDEAAQANLDAETSRAAAARLSLAGNVVLQALEIASLQSQIKAAQEVIDADNETVSLAEKAVKLGAQPEVSTLVPGAQLAQDEAALPPLKRRLSQARNAFAALLGEAPGKAVIPNFTLADFQAPSDVPVAVPSELVRRRPDIVAAEQSLHASVALIGVRQADLYPKIALTGSITNMADTFRDAFNYEASGWRYGLDLTTPIFHGGALRARVGVAKADAQAAAARYNQTVLRAFVEVADAMSALTYDTETLTAQRRALEVAQSNLNARKRLFELGRGEILDTLDAQRQANIARRAAAAADGERLKSLATLYAATATIDAAPKK